MVMRLNLKTMVDEVCDEIMRYKWLESEKAGGDIGENRAANEWISKHYNDWFKFNYRRYMCDD
jgi:hypothetical protein